MIRQAAAKYFITHKGWPVIFYNLINLVNGQDNSNWSKSGWGPQPGQVFDGFSIRHGRNIPPRPEKWHDFKRA